MEFKAKGLEMDWIKGAGGGGEKTGREGEEGEIRELSIELSPN